MVTLIVAAVILSVAAIAAGAWLVSVLSQADNYDTSLKASLSQHLAQYRQAADAAIAIARSRTESTSTVAVPAGYRFKYQDGTDTIVKLPTADRWMSDDGTVYAESQGSGTYWSMFYQETGILGQDTILLYSPGASIVPSDELHKSFDTVEPLLPGWFLVSDD
jgi:hypothetical protein